MSPSENKCEFISLAVVSVSRVCICNTLYSSIHPVHMLAKCCVTEPRPHTPEKTRFSHMTDN